MQSILGFIGGSKLSGTRQSPWIALTMVPAAGCISAVAEGQTAWRGQKIALKLRSIVIGEIYDKVLKRTAASTSSEEGPNCADAGTITNLIVSDSAKIADAGSNAYELWATVPVQVAVALGMLSYVLGPSALAGVLMMLLMTPINTFIIGRLGKAAMEAMGASDKRTQETDQVLRNIRMIKYFAWDTFFQRKILDRRATELAALRSRLLWWSIAATIWYAVPFVITFLSFFAFTVLQRGDLTPSIAFTALSLFNNLKAPLDQLVGMISRIRESLESVKRVEAFLREAETTKSFEHKTTSKSLDQEKLGFENTTVSWSSTNHATNTTFWLQDLQVIFTERRLNVIAGFDRASKGF